MDSLFIHGLLLTFAWLPFALGAWLTDDMTAEPVRQWFARLGHAPPRATHHRLGHAH